MLVNVFWVPRADRTAARNVYFGLAGELQSRSPEGTDTRDILRAAFKLSFNEFDPDAITRYGTDGLAELLADPDLATARIRVSARRGPLARIAFEGLGKKSQAYEAILVELTEKVVRVADKMGHNSYREVFHSVPGPVAYGCGWDLVVQTDALYRQPNLPDVLFAKFHGPQANVLGLRLARVPSVPSGK
jgi:hypothetical protein